MKSHSLLSEPLNGRTIWFSLALGSGLQQPVTLVLIILIWGEWHWPKFKLFAVAIGACTTGLYVALVLLATKFPEELSESGGRTDSGQALDCSLAKCNRTISLEHAVLLLNGGMQNLKRR
jgi:hypothetical protein